MFLRATYGLFPAFALVLTTTACSSSVPDRYAFWRDDNAPPSQTTATPNLGDVPPAPQTGDTLAQLAEIRARLEQQRDQTYGTVTHTTVMPTELQQPYYPPAPSANPYGQTQAGPSIAGTATYQYETESAYPVQSSTAPNSAQPFASQWENGNVAYRYGNTQETAYVYGHSAVNIRSRQGMAQPMPHYVSNDPSIQIDWSALGNNNTGNDYVLSPVGLSGDPLIYYQHGSSRLGSNDRATLQRLAEQLKATPQSVVIIGHASRRTGIADAAASRQINLQMSARRSMGVVHALTGMGVSIEQLKAVAAGDSFATGNETGDRRVDIMLGQ